MKVEVLHCVAPIEQKPLVQEVLPDPVPGPEDVLIRIRACGVCHSNLHMIEGDLVQYGIPSKLPIIPGHEITGTIEDVGKNVQTRQIGQNVGVQVLFRSCGRCKYCITGRENICSNANYTGETVDGGFAELMIAPHDFTFLLSENLGFEEAAPLFCPGVTAYRSVRRAGIVSGQKVAVIGVGGVGHMSLQFARLAGADVTVVDISRKKLDFALKLGAENAVFPNELGELKFDVVLVHTPSQKAVDEAVKAVVSGGVILLAVHARIDVDYYQEYTVMTSVIGTRTDMLNTLNLASKGRVRAKWHAHRLGDANEILLDLKKGTILGKAILVP